MPTPHIFALPHAEADDYLLPTSPSGRPRKRKRRSVARDNGNNEDDHAPPTSESESNPDQINPAKSASEAYTSLTRDQLTALRTAGLSPGDEVPAYPFPHTSKERSYVLSDVRAELKDLHPPLAHLDPSYYAPLPFASKSERSALREQHSAVLVTLLHLSLERGDYARAGRAWGLLLRSGYMSRDLSRRDGVWGMDVRTHGRWGIGAELLLRRQTEDTETPGDSEEGGGEFSGEGFALARQYYERLVIQYPAHHSRKGAQASTFYTAMFSLWIYELSQLPGSSSPFATRSASLTRISTSPTLNSDEEDEDALPASENRLEREIKALTTKLDDVLSNPPFDQNPELLQMRGMVALWVVDLTNESDSKVAAVRFFTKAKENGGQLPRAAQEILRNHGEGDGDEEMGWD